VVRIWPLSGIGYRRTPAAPGSLAGTGGPKVLLTPRRGFGQTVIVDLAQAAVQGEARLAFSDTGVQWELHGPADSICEAS
jgi:hypothetical protein